ncbi:MAG: hypothetical protein CM1200mP21_06500 [Candidatus Poseidoniales archaeon]|nr:MAG: hypothetical protein CM1200mP21_06500 [Candidatus Poseidoniales archaeon]
MEAFERPRTLLAINQNLFKYIDVGLSPECYSANQPYTPQNDIAHRARQSNFPELFPSGIACDLSRPGAIEKTPNLGRLEYAKSEDRLEKLGTQPSSRISGLYLVSDLVHKEPG